MVVTHEMTFAREVADRVVFMDGGVIVEDGTPDQVIANPGHTRTRHFLSRLLDPAMAEVEEETSDLVQGAPKPAVSKQERPPTPPGRGV
jgi:polar amino acid transport system ATP-binding protein